MKKNDLKKTIGQSIRKYRELHSMSREAFAEKLSLDTAYVGQCERGERQLTLSHLVTVCSLFEITMNDLIDIPEISVRHVGGHSRTRIDTLLDGCTENQLAVLQKMMENLIPFLKR